MWAATAPCHVVAPIPDAHNPPLWPLRLCGAHGMQGASIGDVFVSTGKMHHDRRIPLPGYDKQGLGFVESTPTPNLRNALGLKSGIVTTGAEAWVAHAPK